MVSGLFNLYWLMLASAQRHTLQTKRTLSVLAAVCGHDSIDVTHVPESFVFINDK